MGDVNHLADRSAIEKIKHIAGGEIAMLCTFGTGSAMQTRPMATQGIDEDGTFWFFSGSSSAKNREIAANPDVQLVYAVPSRSEYLSVQGQATISRDRGKIAELWSLFAKTWFTRGKDDPELTLIGVTPTGGHYWDTKHNKMVQLAKIAIGAMTGKTMDDGIEGSLKL